MKERYRDCYTSYSYNLRRATHRTGVAKPHQVAVGSRLCKARSVLLQMLQVHGAGGRRGQQLRHLKATRG
jgi:hypothetical protein